MVVDFENAYCHVPIHRKLQKFLMVQVGQDTFQFKVIPFGFKMGQGSMSSY